jgi:hypothetical protein
MLDKYGNEYERPVIENLKNFPAGGSLVKRGSHWYIAFREYFYKKEIGRESERRTYWGKVVGDTCYSNEEYRKKFKRNGQPRLVPLDDKINESVPTPASVTVSKEPQFLTSRRFLHLGFGLVVYGLLRSSGVRDDLVSAGFEDVTIRVILSLVMYNLCERDNAFYMVKDWQEGRLLPFTGEMSSKDLSKFFATLGAQDDLINKFFKCRANRLEEEEPVSIDTTSIGCESENITRVAYGVGKHKENRNQFGVYFVVGHKSKMPIMYRILAGNIHDSTTIEDFIKRAKELELDKGNHVNIGDKGYYSENNLIMASVNDVKVIFSVKALPDYIVELVDKNYDAIVSCESIVPEFTHLRGQTYEHSFYTDDGTEVKIWVHIFFDIKAHGEKINALEKKLLALEKAWNAGDPKAVNEKSLLTYYKKPADEPGKCKLERDLEKYKQETMCYGMFCNTSNFEQTISENISYYSSRDVIEKCFKNSKGNDFDVARAHDDTVLNGRFFVLFIASICLGYLSCKMGESKTKTLKNGRIKYEYPAETKFSYKQLIQKFKVVNCLLYDDGKCALSETPGNLKEFMEKIGYAQAVADALNDAQNFIIS